MSLAAPFPYFGGKSRAAPLVWGRLGQIANYVEPFAGSAAMLLQAPDGKRTETINDADGFVANFWRAVAADPEAVAHHADWPCSEADLEARHAWLVNRADRLRWQLEDPDFYCAKIAGWWVWGCCNWIGSGWCAGVGPHKTTGAAIYDSRQLPHLSAGQGINRKLPHLGDAGRGASPRSAFILDWMRSLSERMRDVRVACGDWRRVVSDSVTVRHGLTGTFLDPPYSKGAMDYAAGGVGSSLPLEVQSWCAENGNNRKLRIALCGHEGEHAALTDAGWSVGVWKARKGYAISAEAVANSAGETVWFSPHCLSADSGAGALFEGAA